MRRNDEFTCAENGEVEFQENSIPGALTGSNLRQRFALFANFLLYQDKRKWEIFNQIPINLNFFRKR
ncbi:MAG: hypothetical protein CL840_16350 [Crocinitomicaceae bacterium]|nr:hypothetical protein [Crocinitomicaceae bacterium]